MNAPLDWSTLANGAKPPHNIVSFPGWGVPVIKALTHSVKHGLPQDALRDLSQEDVRRGNDAFKAISVAREVGVLFLECRELGKAFGLDLFERTASQIAEELSADRTKTDEPELAMNVPAMLCRFHEAALSITSLHAHRQEEPTKVAFAHWCAARAALGGEIVQLIGGMLADAAVTLNRTKELDDWCDGLADVVMAKVFPNWTDEPKSEAWVQERLDRYEDVRVALLRHHGWEVANG